MRLKAGTGRPAAIWRWSDTRPLLMRACELITAKQAERRVLMLETRRSRERPSSRRRFSRVAGDLRGIAPTHRYRRNALRLIVEGEGAYTAVDGERIPMRPGDFVVTPGWACRPRQRGLARWCGWTAWTPALPNLFGAHFREDYPKRGSARRGPGARASVIPYERTRANLEQFAERRFRIRRTAGSCGYTIATLARILSRPWRFSCNAACGDSPAASSAAPTRGVLRGRRKGGVHVARRISSSPRTTFRRSVLETYRFSAAPSA